MYDFKHVIEEIEKALPGAIDLDALARQMNMSVYEFRRIFTFVTKMPPGEYIRKRRLSLAAVELAKGEKSVSALAEAYGYDSPSSFSRAFREFHGLSPSDVMAGAKSFRLLTRISAEIIVSGCRNIAYTVKHEPAFDVSGLCNTSTLTDTECCEDCWNAFYNATQAEEILKEGDALYAVYTGEKDVVHCCIGLRVKENTCRFPHRVHIPEREWACFLLRGAEDSAVNEFYNSILWQWFTSTGYERDLDVPNVEVYPTDMSQDDFPWEIRIPIKRSTTP